MWILPGGANISDCAGEIIEPLPASWFFIFEVETFRAGTGHLALHCNSERVFKTFSVHLAIKHKETLLNDFQDYWRGKPRERELLEYSKHKVVVVGAGWLVARNLKTGSNQKRSGGLYLRRYAADPRPE